MRCFRCALLGLVGTAIGCASPPRKAEPFQATYDAASAARLATPIFADPAVDLFDVGTIEVWTIAMSAAPLDFRDRPIDTGDFGNIDSASMSLFARVVRSHGDHETFYRLEIRPPNLPPIGLDE